jgi:hypothetical protein
LVHHYALNDHSFIVGSVSKGINQATLLLSGFFPFPRSIASSISYTLHLSLLFVIIQLFLFLTSAQHISRVPYNGDAPSILLIEDSPAVQPFRLTLAQTRLAEAQYDYKIAEVPLAYSAGGRSELEIDSASR